MTDVTPGVDGGEMGLHDLEPRVVTLDIEVDDRGDDFPAMGEERVLSIVAHDNYTEETTAFIDFSSISEEQRAAHNCPDNIDELRPQDTERKMFIDFRSYMDDVDPDIITGWNVDDFDMKFILKRMEKINGLTPSALSPTGWAGVTRGGEPRVKGRTIYDLLTVYKKNSFTNIRSYTLDDVAKEELGAEKIKFDGSFYELYENDWAEFLRYNARDVHLTVGINEEAGVIQFRDVLRREVGVRFEDSYDNKDFVDMQCRRKLHEWGVVGPTRPDYGDEPDSDFEGAFVFDPYTGVTSNVVGIDLASLYPYTMAMLNSSPETLVPPNVEITDDFTYEIFDRSGTTVEQEIPVCVASNDAVFERDKVGMFAALVEDSIALKMEYKEKLLAAETEEERKKWQEKYNSAKTITNSIYGVAGWERFFLYDEKVAEAVTLTGQTVIKRTAEYVEESGYDVIYGDTDSCYIKFPDEWDREQCLKAARELTSELNDEVYPELAESMGIPADENLWEIEVEAYMKRYFQAGKKKRYAYLATWKDGHEIDDPSPSISGFSSKRSDSSTLTEETEKEVFDAILSGNADDVHDIVFQASKEITSTAPNWERIGIPGGMNKKITDDPELGAKDSYYAVSCSSGNCHPQDAHPRAVWNSNQILNLGLGSGDKPMRVYVKDKEFAETGRSVDVLAFLENSDMEPIEDTVVVDVQRMKAVLLIRPLGQILDAIDIDINAAVQGQTQTGLGAFS